MAGCGRPRCVAAVAALGGAVLLAAGCGGSKPATAAPASASVAAQASARPHHSGRTTWRSPGRATAGSTIPSIRSGTATRADSDRPGPISATPPAWSTHSTVACSRSPSRPRPNRSRERCTESTRRGRASPSPPRTRRPWPSSTPMNDGSTTPTSRSRRPSGQSAVGSAFHLRRAAELPAASVPWPRWSTVCALTIPSCATRPSVCARTCRSAIVSSSVRTAAGSCVCRQPGSRAWSTSSSSRITMGNTQIVCDPGNPRRAPGAFGEKSVVLAPSYRPPSWLREPHAQGSARRDRRTGARPARSRSRSGRPARARCRCSSPTTDPSTTRSRS